MREYPGSVTLAVLATGSPSSSKAAMICGLARCRAVVDVGNTPGAAVGGLAITCLPSPSLSTAWLAETGVGAAWCVTLTIWKPPGSSAVGP